MRQLAAALCASMSLLLAPDQLPAQRSPTLVIKYQLGDTVETLEEGAFLIGRIKIIAYVEPSAVPPSRIDFFVDGRNVCTRVSAPFECPFDMGPTPKKRVISVAAATPTGVLTARITTSEISDSVHVFSVHVPVMVTDAKGHAIRGLNRESFKLFVDNVEQTIANVIGESPSIQVVMALDVSASMASSMSALKKGILELASQLKDADQLTLLAFNNTTFRVGQSASDHKKLAALLDRINPTGNTALYDMLIKSIGEFAQAVGVSRALVVFTDGADTGSKATARRAERDLLASDVIFYFVTKNSGRKSDEGLRLIQTVTGKTGGLWSEIGSLSELGGALADIVEDIKNQYLLTFEPTVPQDGRLHEIRVDIVGRQGVHVRARRNFVAGQVGW